MNLPMQRLLMSSVRAINGADRGQGIERFEPSLRDAGT